MGNIFICCDNVIEEEDLIEFEFYYPPISSIPIPQLSPLEFPTDAIE